MTTKKTNDTKVIELTGPQAAAFTGVTYRQFNNLLKAEYPPPRQGNKKFRSDMLGGWLRERVGRELRVEIHTDPDKLDGHHELARKNKELADKTMLENAVRRGELIEASQVEQAWETILLRVKSRVMSIPTSAAPLLIGVDDQAVIQETIDEMVRDALAELSADWRGDIEDS